MCTAKDLRASLAAIIGRDVWYVTALEEDQHLHAMPFIEHYATTLFFVFATSAAKAIWQEVINKAKELGKRVGERSFKELQSKLSRKVELQPNESDSNDLKEIQKTSDALDAVKTDISLLGNNLSKKYIQDFLRAGKEAVQQQLLNNNFPPDKATRIAEKFTSEIEGRYFGFSA
jgi:hypothetical protein